MISRLSTSKSRMSIIFRNFNKSLIFEQNIRSNPFYNLKKLLFWTLNNAVGHVC